MLVFALSLMVIGLSMAGLAFGLPAGRGRARAGCDGAPCGGGCARPACEADRPPVGAP